MLFRSNVFYRRQQVYSIPGKLPNLGDFIIAGSQYGGPLGIFMQLVDGYVLNLMRSVNAGLLQAHRSERLCNAFRKGADSRVFSGGRTNTAVQCGYLSLMCCDASLTFP